MYEYDFNFNSIKRWRYNVSVLDIQGLTNNDTNTFLLDFTTEKMYVYDMEGNVQIDSWVLTGSGDPLGVGHYNESIWTCDRQDDKVYRWHINGTAISSFSFDPSQSDCWGLTTNGKYIWVSDKTSDKVYVYEGVLDATPPNVTINQPLDQVYATNTISFNVTALDDTGMSDCNYTLNSGATNFTMANLSTSPTQWIATNSTMSEGAHEVIYHCWDTSNNLNNSESVSFSISTVAPIPAGGGGSIMRLAESLGIENVSKILCNLTYDSLLTFGIDYSKIDSIKEEYETITDESIVWTEVRTYMDNWQPLCSDLVEKTLEPEWVCNRIYDFVIDSNYKPEIEEINNLTNRLNERVDISLELVVNYINNYEDKCYRLEFSPSLEKIKLSPIVTEGEINILWALIVVVFITLLSFSYIIIKKKGG